MKNKKFYKKIIRLLYVLSFFPIFICYYLIIFFNKKKIRLYSLKYNFGADDHMEIYLSEKINEQHKNYCDIIFLQKSFDRLILKSKKYNYFWSITLLMNCNDFNTGNRYLMFIFSFFWETIYFYLTKINLIFNSFVIPLVPMHPHPINKDVIKNSKILHSKNSLISFDKKNYEVCESEFEKIKKIYNINRPIVTILNRDSAFKDFVDPNRDWTYHDYRDSKISDFIEASNYLIESGYFVIRHGNKTLEKLDIHSKYFFDYSKSELRSSYMDIYLIKKSSFFIVVGGSGLWQIASFFNIPTAHVNWLHLRYLKTFTGISIFIPKKLFDVKKNEFLSFSTYLDPNYRISKISNLPLGLYTNTKEYENAGIKIINNSSTEILKLVSEMNLIINNKLELDEEDVKLQKKFWSNFDSDFPFSKQMLISPYFIKNNQSLL